MTNITTKVAVTVAAVASLLFASEAAVAQCCGDCNGNGKVTVDEVVTAANNALEGCSGAIPCGRFPASGQTTPYGTGSDGGLRAGAALSYTDNGDGTITDNNTGLMWEKKSLDGSIHDQSTVYAWPDAFNLIGGLNAGGGFAGYTDWRLPNVKELQSIINYQNFDPAVSAAFNANCAPGCTVTTCSCTQSLFSYWSSTAYQVDPNSAWVVFFFGGIVNAYDKSNFTAYVRAVRGGL